MWLLSLCILEFGSFWCLVFADEFLGFLAYVVGVLFGFVL